MDTCWPLRHQQGGLSIGCCKDYERGEHESQCCNEEFCSETSIAIVMPVLKMYSSATLEHL